MSVAWSVIEAEIIDEMDLANEDIADTSELMSYANDGIRRIGAQILAINEGKYFEADTPLNLTAGVATIAPPADIYANKITGIFYNDGANKYQVEDLKKKDEIAYVQPTNYYRFRISNNAGIGTQITLYPTPAATAANVGTIFYIREPKVFAADTDLLDIPEAKSFIKQYVKDRVSAKERMAFNEPDSPALQQEQQNLLDALSTMLVDGADRIPPDFSYYNHTVGNC